MAEIVPPQKRRCLRCGRRDVWDDDAETWVAAEEDGERRVGRPHCLHEWDINGTHTSVREDA
jgi:hypothetical protein